MSAQAVNSDDQRLPEDPAIRDAHPLYTGRHDLYDEAMRLVGAKHSRGALVALVNWLLSRVAQLETEGADLTRRLAASSGAIIFRGWWCLPCDSFNPEEHAAQDACRKCGLSKLARP